MICLENVTKTFDNVPAITDVCLDLPAGSVTALIGPSGCGKSTLLRMMIGLIEPDAGTVSFDGLPMMPDNLRSIRPRIGYAIQSGGLFPHMTGRRNIALPAQRAGWSRNRIKSRLDALADLMHLTADELDRYPAQLSGGQRQRVALSRALVLEPDVLLLDEPLGALDPVIRSTLQDELVVLFEELRQTVVLVTHDLAEAATLAPHNIVLMREGSIEQRGSFLALHAQPVSDFAAGFIAAQTRRVASLLAEAE